MITEFKEVAGSCAKGSSSVNSGTGSYSQHVFQTPLEWLVNLRDVVLPEILREASGLRGETDLELLLDGSGYSVSLVAEELISMIDECIESKSFDSHSLEMIRRAYNGLSGFDGPMVSRKTG
ncbi:MAG: hypothetical protein R6U39_10025 [Candidatus Aegiribacteria sp.]